jgi:hypothetical protein
MEAMRWRVPIEISREDLERLVETSEVVSEQESHRPLYEAGSGRAPGEKGGPEAAGGVLR